ncbi:N-alpha-acetyltransferase 40-like isoform X2 [Xenia sp. Carnegie-2017]|nr:N-alpha-acetyltransferase 40-like isoform X2 [Xenia sp. Carnegie-2017]XP_046848880.1 N-alpha-acetyltransferase 40-like isoform X2 [Xenia sp. Carnegie-2017]XP_046848881.1 N-alpha-acetyltransferase 40-like isoform X2 [Xenia sp. Carnegie-2017]
MKKKSGKGKEKKLKRKEEQAKISAAQLIVDAANNVDDLMKPLSPFTKYDRNGLKVSIKCIKICDMNKDDFDWAFQLTKTNMQVLYEKSSWGWNDKKKHEEMSEDNAWYLIAADENGKSVGLSHFRFDLDNDVEVLYCYEIQLDKSVRNRGLGKFLMQILQLLAHRYKMKKVMVTVFKDNEKAMDFFTKLLKFENDETSPRYYDPLNPEDYCYEILSRPVSKSSS